MDHHEKRNQNSRSEAFKLKLTDTRAVIRNKFKKACVNRLKCEREVNHAMKPLATTANKLKSFECGFSLPKTTSKSCRQQQLPAEIHSHHSKKSRKIETIDPNRLCNRLKVLLASTNMCDDVQRAEEINAIINHLRKLEILV